MRYVWMYTYFYIWYISRYVHTYICALSTVLHPLLHKFRNIILATKYWDWLQFIRKCEVCLYIYMYTCVLFVNCISCVTKWCDNVINVTGDKDRRVIVEVVIQRKKIGKWKMEQSKQSVWVYIADFSF